MISYVIPTRNRREVLNHTLNALAALPQHTAEVIIVDNASDQPVTHNRELANGLALRIIRSESNLGAAARNIGVLHADTASKWIVMLDDDSAPEAASGDISFIDRLRNQAADVGAVLADIHLPRQGRREDGGLPEVFIGCGVAIRRDAFLSCGGYDPAFGYYAEEYDLAAKLMLSGYRMVFDAAWRIDHQKDASNRNIALIVERLTRNNGWVMQRYAPEHERRARLREIRKRYRMIAGKEAVRDAYARGLVELRRTVRQQVRREMPRDVFDRFTGLAAMRKGLEHASRGRMIRTFQIVAEGKNCWAARQAALERGWREVPARSIDADVQVIGTLSPGPMIDAMERYPAAVGAAVGASSVPALQSKAAA
ncbi:MAG: glycosyltransferase [Planctomycetes bacterium]|nr:glycosyltransferase [Planctomycetota bacterium]